MALASGTLLQGRYRVLGSLGQGGMGEVYLGRDESGQRPVAIKALRSELQDEDFVRRFQAEVEILRGLQAPGVPAFVDAFCESDRSFLVMEYVEGHSLESLLTRCRANTGRGLRPLLVVQVALQVCQTLAFLHRQTPPLLHRDIKPANLIIRSQDERVFLVDFGLAREFRPQAGGHTLVGTLGYCPLEQFQGNPEPRSDLYALGATMFELLTGVVPRALNIPPLVQVLPALPQEFCQVLDRVVSHQAEARFASAEEFSRALESALPSVERISWEDGDQPPGDQVEALILNWGQKKVSFSPLRSWVHLRRALWSVALVLLMLSLGIFAWDFRGRQRYESRQSELFSESLGQGGPGPGWQVAAVTGLFPADGLGLGEPDREWDRSPRSGVFLSTTPARQVRAFSWRVRLLKGRPRLLAFCGSWGMLLEPKEAHWILRPVKVDAGLTLETTPWVEFPEVRSPEFGDFRRLKVECRLEQGQLRWFRDGVPQGQVPAEGGWQSNRCGLLLLNPWQKARCVIEEWRLE